MPTKRKGADLNRNTSKSRSLRNRRSERTEEQIQQQNTDARVRMAQLRQEESEDTRAERNEVIRLEQRQSRRFTVNRRRTNDQQRQQVHRAFTSDSFLRLAFQYEPDIEYYAHSKVVIGAMDKECPHCHALKFKNEPAGMCCASGKVQLPEIETPSEPLNGLLIGTDPDSNVFLKSIRTFNSCFQMTSFGATEIVRNTNANVLTTCFSARAQILWDNHKDSMTDDILHQHRTRCHDLTITFSDAMYNEALIAIEDLCIVIANLPLSHFGMISPNRTESDLMNTEMNRELQYNTVEMAAIVARNVPLMNEEQRTVYDRIMLAVSAGQGDFRQTLPVIPRSTYADEINACLKSSPLWRNVEKVQLKVNMRVQMLQHPSAETFSKQLLDIGDGKVAIDETGYVKLPTDFCTIADSQDTLIEQIFPDVHTQYINHEWLAERAILAAKNVDVDNLNLKIQM
ncbi:DNA helicase Pif1-like, partial [Cinara cedri]